MAQGLLLKWQILSTTAKLACLASTIGKNSIQKSILTYLLESIFFWAALPHLYDFKIDSNRFIAGVKTRS
ncbi:hypothetical protein PND46_09890, partial [Lacticaseibacillus rhamnosus]|uniref:hypothetical protein n=1 Tax=Lacticaseibacillus rhamnosus TaxID=47715 RepID=UPI00232E053E